MSGRIPATTLRNDAINKRKGEEYFFLPLPFPASLKKEAEKGENMGFCRTKNQKVAGKIFIVVFALLILLFVFGRSFSLKTFFEIAKVQVAHGDDGGDGGGDDGGDGGGDDGGDGGSDDGGGDGGGDDGGDGGQDDGDGDGSDSGNDGDEGDNGDGDGDIVPPPPPPEPPPPPPPPPPSPAPGTIIILKDTVPDDATVFSFTSNTLTLNSFQLDDDGDNANALSNSRTFSNLAAGTYDAAETANSGYNSSSGCSDESSVDAINLAAGETVTCTFTNTFIPPPPPPPPPPPGRSGPDCTGGCGGGGGGGGGVETIGISRVPVRVSRRLIPASNIVLSQIPYTGWGDPLRFLFFSGLFFTGSAFAAYEFACRRTESFYIRRVRARGSMLK